MAQANPDDSALRLVSVTKRFGEILANNQVNIDVRAGSWHAIVGENGAGKSTLLNILYGVYRPDEGHIFIKGKEVTSSLRQPADAIRMGIGLVAQNYSLAHGLSVLENLVLGQEPTQAGGRIDWKHAEQSASASLQSVGLPLSAIKTRVDELSPAAQQKVEIAKALFRNARILLLDEPTSTLAPQEADALFAILRRIQSSGTTIVVVTHKLDEVFAHSDSVTVMRSGLSVGTFRTVETTPSAIFQAMIGESASSDTPHEITPPDQVAEGSPAGENRNTPALRLKDLSIAYQRGAIRVEHLNLIAYRGEILGFAGVDGNGQNELAEALVGLRTIASGELALDGRSLNRLSVRERAQAGVAYIPANRNRDGLIPSFSIAQNLLLGHETDSKWGGGWFLQGARVQQIAADVITEYAVKGAARAGKTPVVSLSGGNQQKVLVGRALRSEPKVIVACQPTRGLDIRSSQAVYQTLRIGARRGMTVLLFSLDLDEVLELSDRVVVMYNGAVSPSLARKDADRNLVGQLMMGLVSFDKLRAESHVTEDATP
jgi:simple sugar transport system ATP-binding protein